MIAAPIDHLLPTIARSLRTACAAVIQAPPGCGKTTRVAPYLLRDPSSTAWLAGRKIVMLEPRRLAARSAATFMARALGESVGETIGYHIRLERKVSVRTRVEIVTEGLLTQRLLSDPELRDVGLIIFDEFHERSLAADVGLALALDSQRALRPDLRLIVMSATLDPSAIAAHLAPCSIHTATVRQYPIATRLLSPNPRVALPQQVATAILHALTSADGSLLAFLPGEGEIRRTQELLLKATLPPNTTIHPLYGALSRSAQEAAILPTLRGQRKVVLATSIAETSLTIEGINIVVDCGWMRVPRFSPRHGMSRLETLRVTRDRADQRRGRAGRLAPGVCYRLWDEAIDNQLSPTAPPEIMDADLTPVVLHAAEWGSTAREALPWLTPPPAAAWHQATELLTRLNALDATAHITAHGRRMVQLTAHPRLAHAILHAAPVGAAHRAALLAAVITEAPTHSALRHECDVERLLAATRGNTPFGVRTRELARRWAYRYPADRGSLSCGLILAWAFPERVARRRGPTGNFLLHSGRGATIDPSSPLAASEWLVAVELQDDTLQATIRLAAAITFAEIEEHFADTFTHTATISWDKRTEAVQTLNSIKFGAITVREGGQSQPDATAVMAALFEGILQKGLDQLPWSKSALALKARINFLHRLLPEAGWPDLCDESLAANLDTWLAPFCVGMSRWSHLQTLNLHDVLMATLHARRLTRRELDELAPTHLTVPSGSKIQLRYDDPTPYMEVRIQEVFGMTRTPVIAKGRVALVMRLLSPAHRPVQVTQDLASFWQNGYPLIRKELRGRYPKHHWPLDPLQAVPTRRPR